MRVMIRPRRGGKTHAILAEMYDNPDAVLMVTNRQMKDIIIEQAAERGLDLRRRVITPNETERLRGMDGPLLIDNLDEVFYQLLGGSRHIDLVTMTAEAV